MYIKQLPTPGVEIIGIDLSDDMSDNEVAAIHEAFSDHGLVFFRDQSMTEKDHIRLAQHFGPININRFFTSNDEYPEIAMVTKEPDQEANIGGGWHTDHSYDEEPALGSILVARELPDTGGDTWFACMYRAYDSLSSGLKSSLEHLDAVHSAQHVFGSAGNYESDKSVSGRIGNPDLADELSDVVHPVVISHPLSGRKALYVNPGFTLRFDGWTAEESEPLLGFLYEHAVDDAHVTRFNWEPGSIAFWDNRSTWHFAQNDYQGQRREMHRITIAGCELNRA